MKADGHTKTVNDDSIVDGWYRTRSATSSEITREPKSTNGFEVPWKQAHSLVQRWPGSRLTTTVGLGHRQIVKDPEVVASAVCFISAAKKAARVAPAARAPESTF